MASLYLVKIIRDTHLWKKGQKTWVVMWTGDAAALVLGRYKGRGRWIEGWAHYNSGGWHDAKWIGEVTVRDEYVEYLLKVCKSGYLGRADTDGYATYRREKYSSGSDTQASSD